MSYVEDMFGLAGKTAIITGGGGVIAGALSEALLGAGANVSLWEIQREAADAAANRLVESCRAEGRVQGVVADAFSEERVREALAETEKRFGSVDILINCAGGNRGTCRFVELDVAAFESIVRLNLIAGLVVPTKVVATNWISRKQKGCVINMCSMGSYIPLSAVWAYDAAKAAVLNLTMATAKEFAAQGIRVNALAPGFFVGKQNRALLIDEKTGNLTLRGQSVISHTPFGRFGEAKELSGALLFLASDKAAGFVTGVSIPVDGGFLVDNI